MEYLVVGRIAQGGRIKVVGIHELVEDVCADHYRVGNRNLYAMEIVTFGMTLYD